ncbi:putative RNA-directed DNA polymerase [Rosa chinensis]|uniref:Putative RNA-directed DNA polymerase n=1 Tax=Rosa chinensis TaxID=74649 RepID=A0A2P6RYL8_ROSCH|nr:putative RNA-directed DNA polymerase [Rosa chinensis]
MAGLDAPLLEGRNTSNSGLQKIEVSVQHPDSSSSSFGGAKLNGPGNYRTWKKMISAHLRGIHKMGHVVGTIKAPLNEESEEYVKWEDADGLVLSILYKAMTDEVIQLIIGCDTAAEVWKTLNDLYLNESDFSQIYELLCKATRMKQDGQAVSVFYTQLKNVWAEIDQRRPNKLKNAEDITWYQKEKELERVHQFLSGLDARHDSAKGELLRRQETPSLTEAFTYIRKDESQQDSTKAVYSEISSLTIQAKPPRAQGPPPGFSTPRSGLQPITQGSYPGRSVCQHCKLPGHTKETCYKLVGYPAGYFSKPKPTEHRGRGKAVVNLVQSSESFGVVGQDYTTSGDGPPSVSMVARRTGSSDQGSYWQGVYEGKTVSSGSSLCRGEAKEECPSRFDNGF